MQPKWRHKMQLHRHKTKNKDRQIFINEALKITKPSPIMYCFRAYIHTHQAQKKAASMNRVKFFFCLIILFVVVVGSKINSHYSDRSFFFFVGIGFASFPWRFVVAKAINFSTYFIQIAYIHAVFIRQHVRQIDRN